LSKHQSRTLLNIACFQLGWFACVLGAAQSMPWIGPLVAVPVIALHLYQADNSRLEIVLMLIAAFVGSLFDQSLLSLGLIKFTSGSMHGYLLPLWMVTLWLLFATTLNVSLRWMRGRPVVAVIFGVVGGPLAYMGGVKLGAMQFLQPPPLLIALAIGWGIFMPALLWLSTRLDGFTNGTHPDKAIFHV